MILQQPLERGPPGRDPRATTGVTLGLDTRSPCPELLLWRYPGSLIPEALRLLRLGDNPSPYYSASPAGEIMEL